MTTQPPNDTALEVGKVLDTLAALSLDLSCHCDVPPHTLVLPASKLREACDAIDDAVLALKRLLLIAETSGNGPLPPAALKDIGEGPEA
jgi:hypothetical protein